jgi:hypothetical protein
MVWFLNVSDKNILFYSSLGFIIYFSEDLMLAFLQMPFWNNDVVYESWAFDFPLSINPELFETDV